MYNAAMPEKPKSDPNANLHRTLNDACRKWGAREIRLRYLPKPSLNRWVAEALIDYHRVIEKIRADIPLANSLCRTWGASTISRLPAGWAIRQPMQSKLCRPCSGERRGIDNGG